VLYLSDCLWLMPWNSVVFESVWPRRPWRIRSASEWAANLNGALLLLRPLPGGMVFQLDAQPVSTSPKGLAAWTANAWSSKGRPYQPALGLAWKDIDSIRVNDRNLLVNSEVVHHFSNQAAADTWAKHLEALRGADEDERETISNVFQSSLTDTGEIRRRLDQARDATLWLRRTSTAQWILMFVVIPMVLLRLGGPLILTGLAVSLFSCALANAWLFVGAHRKLWPDERWKRAESVVLMLLSWPMAARASDLVTRHLLSSFDPVAVALSFPVAHRSGFIDRVVRDTHHPIEMEELPPVTREICLWQMKRSLQSLTELLTTHHFEVTKPENGSAFGGHVGTYCPRCLATYGNDKETCNDCPGVRLERVDHPKGG